MAVNIFQNMIGRVFTSIEGGTEGDAHMTFHASDGSIFEFYHNSDCCESVVIQDVIGDIKDLLNSPLLMAEYVDSDGYPAPQNADSYTWTFYRFGTANGYVTIRWLGESNGYYSESVDYGETLALTV